MGTIVDPDWRLNLAPLSEPRLVTDDVPDNFDARANWPDCNVVINHVRD